MHVYASGNEDTRGESERTVPCFHHSNHHPECEVLTFCFFRCSGEKWQERRPSSAGRSVHFHFCIVFNYFFSSPIPCADTSALSEWHWHTVNRSPPLPSNNIKHTQAEAGAHKFQQDEIFLRIAFTHLVLINFFAWLDFLKTRKSPNFFVHFIFLYSRIWTPDTTDCVFLNAVSCHRNHFSTFIVGDSCNIYIFFLNLLLYFHSGYFVFVVAFALRGGFWTFLGREMRRESHEERWINEESSLLFKTSNPREKTDWHEDLWEDDGLSILTQRC